MSNTVFAQPRPMVPVLAPLTTALTPVAEIALRAATGLFMLPHAAQKLFGWFGGYGLEATGQFFATKLGLPASFALIASLVELVAGVALALGFATRIAGGAIAVLMAVAVVQVHLGAGFFWTNGGYEYPLLWAILGGYYAVTGGGRVSVDSAIGREI